VYSVVLSAVCPWLHATGAAASTTVFEGGGGSIMRVLPFGCVRRIVIFILIRSFGRTAVSTVVTKARTRGDG
jgi:hypothetical protein